MMKVFGQNEWFNIKTNNFKIIKKKVGGIDNKIKNTQNTGMLHERIRIKRN